MSKWVLAENERCTRCDENQTDRNCAFGSVKWIMNSKLSPGATILSDYVIMCVSVWLEPLALIRPVDGVWKMFVARHVNHSHDSEIYDLFLICVRERVSENTFNTIRSNGPHSHDSGWGSALPYDSIFGCIYSYHYPHVVRCKLLFTVWTFTNGAKLIGKKKR